MIDWYALIVFKTVFVCMSYMDPLRLYFPKSTRYELAQGMVSIVHTYFIILVPLFVRDISKQILYGRVGFTYFIWDTFIILGFTFSTTRMFLIHHLFALIVFYASLPEVAWYNLYVIRDLYYYLECSNALLTVWNFSNRNKSVHSLAYKLTPYFALTYLPLRMVVSPWCAYRVIRDILSHNEYVLWHKLGLSIPIVCLILMSFYYSVIVARITYKRMLPRQPGYVRYD